MSRISSKDFRDHLPGAVGEQVHINHTNCPAGEDTRQRLYITRKDETLYLAYCHNCTGWGALKVTNGATTWKYVNPRVHTVDALLIPEPVPTDLKSLNDSWGVGSGYKKCLNYIQNYLENLDSNFHVADKVVFYSPSLKRIVLHIKDEDNSFWQARGCSGEKLKYYSGKSQDKNAIVLSGRAGNEVCVLTEDILSAVSVATTNKYDAIPLLGTTPANFPQLVSKLSKYKKVIIWLDNDEAGASGGTELHTRLQMLGSFSVARYFSPLDPKKYHVSKIVEMLKPF